MLSILLFICASCTNGNDVTQNISVVNLNELDAQFIDYPNSALNAICETLYECDAPNSSILQDDFETTKQATKCDQTVCVHNNPGEMIDTTQKIASQRQNYDAEQKACACENFVTDDIQITPTHNASGFLHAHSSVKFLSTFFVFKHNKYNNTLSKTLPFSALQCEEQKARDFVYTTSFVNHNLHNSVKLLDDTDKMTCDFQNVLTGYKSHHNQFDLVAFLQNHDIGFFDTVHDYTNVANDTNRFLQENRYCYATFADLACKNNNFYITNDIVGVKKAVLSVLTNNNSAVLNLFPQNSFLSEYVIIDTNYHINNTYMLSFQYLYFLVLFDAIMHVDYVRFILQLKQDIASYNASFYKAKYAQGLAYTDARVCTNRRLSFLYLTKTELQRIFAFLLYPIIDNVEFRQYVLLYTAEKTYLYAEHAMQNTSYGIIQPYLTGNMYLSLIPLFFVASIIENKIQKGFFDKFISSENIFGQTNLHALYNKKLFRTKYMAKRRIRKILYIFDQYFCNLYKITNQEDLIAYNFLQKMKNIKENNTIEKYTKEKYKRSKVSENYAELLTLLDEGLFILSNFV